MRKIGSYLLGLGLVGVLMLAFGGSWGPCGPSSIFGLLGLIMGPPFVLLGLLLLLIDLIRRRLRASIPEPETPSVNPADGR